MQKFRMAFIAGAAAFLAAVASQALAQGASPSEQARQAEEETAWKAGVQAGTRGPADVPLIDQAVLKLPDGFFFVPKAEGARILRALGNTVGEKTFVGLIIGTTPGAEWIVATRYINEGYIKDDDAKNWNADELLQNLKDGTEEANKDRAARGFPELEVLGWVEKPAYDAATHRMVWSLLSKQKDEPNSAVKGINYNTYALGREGYFSLNLLTSADRVAADKRAAHTLLAALAYNQGKGYEDFNAATDHIAEYGLAALIGGVAAKKLGLFALAFAFLAKFAKLIAIGALALGGGVWNFFRSRLRRTSANG
jgi:uncharacterized membrane-anchored protein